MYNLEHVVISGWVLFFYLMLAVLIPLLAVLGVLVQGGLGSGVDTGLLSFLGCLVISWPPFRHVVHGEVLIFSVNVG